MKLISRFQSAVQSGVSILQVLAGITIFATAIGVTLNAIARYAFGRNITILTEAGGFIFLFVVFFGLAATFVAGSHVSVDILSAIAPKKFARLMDKVVVPLISMIFVGAILMAGLTMMQRFFEDGRVTTGTFPIPLWLIMAIVPVGCLAMELALLSRLIEETRRRLGFEETKSR
jgi:TRAP-type C4-dicarboxylate transport system permease small subunit